MKKLKIGIFLLITCLIGMQTGKADMGLPGISPYEIRVNKVEGTTLTKLGDQNQKIKVNYDTTWKVYYEYLENGNLYGEIEWNQEHYLINLSDTESIQKEFSTPEKFDGEKTMYVYKEGAYLYKGPSKTYGKVEGDYMIPVGATIKLYTLNNDDIWGYVTYEGISGWVYYYPYDNHSPYHELTCLINIFKKTKETSFFTTKEINIESSPQSNNIIAKIPANTKSNATFQYYYSPSPNIYYYYISYNGIEGWIKDTQDLSISYSTENKINFLSINEITLYQNDFTTKKNQTIPKNVEGTIQYINTQSHEGNWYYISYNNIEGWAKEELYDPEIYTNFLISTNINYGFRFQDLQMTIPYKEIILEENPYLYEKIDGPKTENILEKGTKIAIQYEYWQNQENLWQKIQTDTQNSWIVNAKQQEMENPEPTEEEPQIPTPSEETPQPQKNFKVMIIYCLFGALIISLTSWVTIRLINKKKN